MGLTPELLARNALYLFGGRNGGLLPYFLPALLLAALGGTKRSRRLVATVLAALLALLVMAPFGFLGPPIANAYFVPLLGALWFVPSRPAARLPLAATWLLAAVLLWPLWLSGRGSPLSSEGALRYATVMPQRLLPFELTQRRLPPAGVRSGDLFYRATGTGITWGEEGRLELDGAAGGELMVVVPAGLDSAYFEFGPESGAELRVEGGKVGETAFLPNGGVLFQVSLDQPLARLPVWWSSQKHHYHGLGLSMPGADSGARYPFRVHGSRRFGGGQP